MNGVQKVYVLGAGAMGSLVANEMATLHGSLVDMILLLKTKRRLDEFRNANSRILVSRRSGLESISSISEINADYRSPTKASGQPMYIQNLILSTKTHNTVPALQKYVPNLDSKSNILILQNGMGMKEKLVETFWPDEQYRPNMFQAISTHGAYKSSPNEIHHVGMGRISIARIPRLLRPEVDTSEADSTPQFIRMLLACETLRAEYVLYDSLLLRQIEKLIVNACINPLTALFDCPNGDLFYGVKTVPLMKKIINEAVRVFKGEFDVFDKVPEANSQLNSHQLLDTVLAICELTAQNSSSMREDVRNLNTTEIDWINGYIDSLGYKHGIPTPVNKLFVSMIKNKLSIEKTLDARSINNQLRN